ncbi:MAG: glycosyltransferase family 2 protein [Anaerolineales bacterium]|nr:glycosyltransferase family 2 protein [Anaerolineales bacterium]
MSVDAASSPPELTQTSSNYDLSVVIPVFNEEQNLKPLYQELMTVLEELGLSYEIIFIDDGSQDTSYQVLKELHAEDKRVKVIQFRRNFGQTASFAAGFDFAQGELIVTLDADGQNDPADIPKLLRKLRDGDYDLVNGWRVDRKEPFVRRFVSRTANSLINRSTQITIHDRGCSLKLFKRDLVKHLRLYGQLHRFLPELASTVGAHVSEVPVNDRARAHGQSKYGSLSRTPRVMLDLVTIIYFLSFFTNPMRFFGTSALISSVLGFLIGSILVFTKIYYGIRDGWAGFHAYEIGNRPLLLLSIFLILLGVQFFMMGILGEMIMRTYYEARDKPTYYIRLVLE